MDPIECLDTPISHLLYPPDAGVFAEATRQLQSDDTHTVEVVFRLRVMQSAEQREQPYDLSAYIYEGMEGKGMLMRDRATGEATHTMWVVRPLSAVEGQDEGQQEARFGLAQHQRSMSDPVTPFPFMSSTFSTETLLCRICERQISAWFFEKHNETCNETHRLELDIANCNERLAELRGSIKGLTGALERGGSTPPSPLEYRGINMLSPPSSSPLGSTDSITGLPRRPASPKPHHFVIRRLQLRLLEQVLEVVQSAIDISTPAAPEEAANIPVEEQRLLSPASENLFLTVLNWRPPTTEDPALSRLAADADEQVRIKLDTINRLRNTIIYAERVRTEWEHKAAAVLPSVTEEERSPLLSGGELPAASLLIANERLTPSTAAPSDSGFTDGASDTELAQICSPPLTGLGLDTLPPPMMAASSSRAASPKPTVGKLLTETPSSSPIRSLGPRPPSATPPSSPNVQALGRHASVSSNPIGSPIMVSAPVSPRIPLTVPALRSKAPSIKDFQVIKPISKGAFGSVYLSKKKTTGDYYAIKVLKKDDMIAKNQVTNVKAERMIMMNQADSEFVVKLFYTFQTRDYLYLVMEYLNGGDCAALIKSLGNLEEDWTRNYIAEVVLGLEHLHRKGIVHR